MKAQQIATKENAKGNPKEIGREKKILATMVAMILCLMLALTGCGGQTASSDAAASTTASGAETTANADMFTDRDLSKDYDEASATKITLNQASAEVNGDGAKANGGTVTITQEGTYIISGSLTDGQIIVEADDTAKVQLVLDGVTIENETLAAIYVKSADKTFVTTAAGSENKLVTTATLAADGETNIDATIFSKDDLCINGSGSLAVTAKAGNGITSKDDLKVTGGDITITATGHGLEGKDSVRVADGTITIDCDNDGLHADNTEDEGKGFIYICGGTFKINAADDGMHAANNLTIDAGEIAIEQSYEGIEGHTIDITGGTIDITSSDDGFNAAGGNDGSGTTSGDTFAMEEVDTEAYLHISGGTITVNCEGDGLDSNGELTITGGTTYVAGPVNAGNGAMDFATGTIKGGTIVATGMSGMAMNFGQDSTQGSMLVTSGSTQNGAITLTDEDGNELVSFSPNKTYNSILISTPDIEEGATYTLTAGSLTSDIEMTSLILGSGSGMGGGPGGMEQGGGPQGGGMPQ